MFRLSPALRLKLPAQHDASQRPTKKPHKVAFLSKKDLTAGDRYMLYPEKSEPPRVPLHNLPAAE
jgi:hypothetical protein